MTLELRVEFAIKKNRISFGKANPMLKVSLTTGNVLNKRPHHQKRIEIFTLHFRLVPNSYPTTEKLNHKQSLATVGPAIIRIYEILMLT